MIAHMQRNKTLKVDFLVLGCGIAGVRAARQEGDDVLMDVGSGDYRFTVARGPRP